MELFKENVILIAKKTMAYSYDQLRFVSFSLRLWNVSGIIVSIKLDPYWVVVLE